VYATGVTVVGDIATGLTVQDATRHVVVNLPAKKLKKLCDLIDQQTVPSSALRSVADSCEQWSELQPRTQIERLPFAQVAARLLVIAPPSSDFARYRGLERASDPTGREYDSILVPNDTGGDTSCVIKESALSGRMLYVYECTIKTHSYQDSVRLKEHLVDLLGGLRLTEDTAAEQGIAAHVRAERSSAPAGEYEGEHVYVSSLEDGKRLQIEAVPEVTRSATELTVSLPTGHDIVSGISSTSASVAIKVVSIGPKATANSPQWPIELGYEQKAMLEDYLRPF
jgi:hypothetical protein